MQLLNICPYFHELDPILGERSSTRPQLTTDGLFHEMDDNEDGLFDEMHDEDQDQNEQAEEETKEEHSDNQSSSSSTSINNVPTLKRQQQVDDEQ